MTKPKRGAASTTKARTATTKAAKTATVKKSPQGPGPKVRVTGNARTSFAATAREQYDSGMSIRAIAAQHGRSYGNVHAVLRESGATFRSRGGARRG